MANSSNLLLNPKSETEEQASLHEKIQKKIDAKIRGLIQLKKLLKERKPDELTARQLVECVDPEFEMIRTLVDGRSSMSYSEKLERYRIWKETSLNHAAKVNPRIINTSDGVKRIYKAKNPLKVNEVEMYKQAVNIVLDRTLLAVLADYFDITLADWQALEQYEKKKTMAAPKPIDSEPVEIPDTYEEQEQRRANSKTAGWA